MDRAALYDHLAALGVDASHLKQHYSATCMEVNGQWYHTYNGAPQGSFEGPKLFCVLYERLVCEWRHQRLLADPSCHNTIC
eukprot:327887-Amphidinium_carterae.1